MHLNEHPRAEADTTATAICSSDPIYAGPMSRSLFLAGLLVLSPALSMSAENANQPPTPPVAEGAFLRPAAGDHPEPVWGLRNGIAVGLWPTAGPRGLLRIYARTWA